MHVCLSVVGYTAQTAVVECCSHHPPAALLAPNDTQPRSTFVMHGVSSVESTIAILVYTLVAMGLEGKFEASQRCRSLARSACYNFYVGTLHTHETNQLLEVTPPPPTHPPRAPLAPDLDLGRRGTRIPCL